MDLLDRLRLRGDFSLPSFDLAPLEFEPEAPDELQLHDVVARLGALPDPAAPTAAAPTAGELHQSIECHLRTSNRVAEGDNPVDELRDVLAQLRRSIG